MKIGVIGLGIMSTGFTRNFLKNGYEVYAWSRDTSKASALESEGAIACASIKDVVDNADIIFETTANDDSAREVWFEEAGILASARSSQTLITCTTLSSGCVDEIARTCLDMSLTFFDMPMTGGRVAAEGGTLTLLVGGDEQKLDALRPVLSAIAADVKYFGTQGSGMRYKLVLNGLQALHIAGMAQALKTAKAVGLDINKVGDALSERPGGVLTNIAWQSYQNPPDPITFSVEWIAKDLKYLQQMHPESLADEALRQYENLVKQDKAGADWTQLIGEVKTV